MEKNLKMEKRQEISKKGYKAFAWSCLIIGFLFAMIFYSHAYFNGFTEANVGWIAVGFVIEGFGVGLACARGFKIVGYDK